MSDPAPLFMLDGACIESGGITTAALRATGGERLVVLTGHFSPFFRLLRAEGRVASGAVRIAGHAVPAALRRGDVALASFETPPLKWTARRYVVESARFASFERRAAERRADAELERAGLAPVANFRLCDVEHGVRRRVSLAAAAVTRATTLVAETPLVDLDATAEGVVTRALERLAEERRLVVSFPSPPLGGRARELFERADFSVTITRGVVSYAGAPVPKS